MSNACSAPGMLTSTGWIAAAAAAAEASRPVAPLPAGLSQCVLRDGCMVVAVALCMVADAASPMRGIISQKSAIVRCGVMLSRNPPKTSMGGSATLPFLMSLPLHSFFFSSSFTLGLVSEALPGPDLAVPLFSFALADTIWIVDQDRTLAAAQSSSPSPRHSRRRGSLRITKFWKNHCINGMPLTTPRAFMLKGNRKPPTRSSAG
mmetsp:Transcript_6469/g.10711  ORF Transcript_6469/g.10711 Transcript_6469/m.10711 type:complete len:205 (+) Transcript_6469:129-743(+)